METMEMRVFPDSVLHSLITLNRHELLRQGWWCKLRLTKDRVSTSVVEDDVDESSKLHHRHRHKNMGAWSVFFRVQGAGGNHSFQRSLIEKENFEFVESRSARSNSALTSPDGEV